jgi:hypothetical protein
MKKIRHRLTKWKWVLRLILEWQELGTKTRVQRNTTSADQARQEVHKYSWARIFRRIQFGAVLGFLNTTFFKTSD